MRTASRATYGSIILLAALLAALPAAAQMSSMSGDQPAMPAVSGYAEGEEILFLHTAASDPEIAGLLTNMMGSPVLTVPALAKAPDELLAQVFVFTNGLKTDGARGPLGFQPDVFDNIPVSDGYSPLRTIVLVTWGDAASARLLKSSEEIEKARQAGDLTVEIPGVVVNMPVLTWPGGRR